MISSNSCGDHERTKRPRDPFFVLIVSTVAIISIWLLLMPLSPAITRVTLKRFHLSSDSFSQWSIQAPIPAMYNFCNRYEVHYLPKKFIVPAYNSRKPRYLNHFPAYVLTSAIGRHAFLRRNKDCWLTIWSSYRGQHLETTIHAKQIADGHFQWVRQSSELLDGADAGASKNLLFDHLTGKNHNVQP